jgi:L-amino acid N-acyltransferase
MIKMQLIQCADASYAIAIRDIFNEAITNSTAIYDYEPRTIDNMMTWFQAKAAGDFPVIGAIDSAGELLGFATYGVFRDRPAYKYTIEHSVYVHIDYRGQGIGRSLMQQLITVAQQQQYHTLIGGIDMSNASSIALHEKLGFTHAGTIKQAGFKFGQWLDLGFYQLVLETPTCPIDG